MTVIGLTSSTRPRIFPSASGRQAALSAQAVIAVTLKVRFFIKLMSKAVKFQFHQLRLAVALA